MSVSSTQDQNQLKAITATALDYIYGWYEADVNRMARALHPRLAKRMVFIDPETGKSQLRDLSMEQMLAYTQAGGAQDVPEDQRHIKVTILDVLNRAASVKIESVKFTDYLHLIQWQGEWVVINVVWENK